MRKRLVAAVTAATVLTPLAAFAQAPPAPAAAHPRPRRNGPRRGRRGASPICRAPTRTAPSRRSSGRPTSAAASSSPPRKWRRSRSGAQEQSGDEGRTEGHARGRRARLQRLLVGPRHQGHQPAHVAGRGSAGRQGAGADGRGAEARAPTRRSGRPSAAPARPGAAPTPGWIAAPSSGASPAACPAR